MRYYFHIALNGDVLEDRNGCEMPSLSDVQCDAIDLAEELEREMTRPPGGTSGYYIEVKDESGKCVFALPIYRDHFDPMQAELRRTA